MGFYDLSKSERERKYQDIQDDILRGLLQGESDGTEVYFGDADTYIRKAAYLGVGRIYRQELASLSDIIVMLNMLMTSHSERIRQTVINAAGEIALDDFTCVEHLFDIGINDHHHSVKNAVQGSLKKAGEKNPMQIIPFCRRHITSSEPEARRTAAHGLELRGRTHPEDVMPVLRLLQFEKHKRVRPMLIHIFGQISYKKGCFEAILEQHRHIASHFRTALTLSPQECENYLRDARIK
jgi:hypothetical protein